VEEWRGLVLTGNGLSGLSPSNIPLVDNRREKSGVTPVCLLRTLAGRTYLSLSDSMERLVDRALIRSGKFDTTLKLASFENETQVDALFLSSPQR